MKITTERLKKIIKEELNTPLNERYRFGSKADIINVMKRNKETKGDILRLTLALLKVLEDESLANLKIGLSYKDEFKEPFFQVLKKHRYNETFKQDLINFVNSTSGYSKKDYEDIINAFPSDSRVIKYQRRKQPRQQSYIQQVRARLRESPEWSARQEEKYPEHQVEETKMKITTDRLRQIIKEELQAVLREEESAEEGMTLSKLRFQPYQHTNSIGQTRGAVTIVGPRGVHMHAHNENEFEKIQKKFIKDYGDPAIQKTKYARDENIVAMSGDGTTPTKPILWRMIAVPEKYAEKESFDDKGIERYGDN